MPEMDMKEKLVELLLQEDDVCEPSECKDCGANGSCYYHRAANRIIANGVTVQEWISVKDRLPEESGEYLTCCGDYDGICVLYYEVLKTKGKWRTKWKDDVTHWMPLPPTAERRMIVTNCKDCKTNCVYRGKDNESRCGSFVGTVTNADRIRAMSDEELAVFLSDEIPHGDCYGCQLDCIHIDKGIFKDGCQNAWYGWLKQPAEKG